MLRKVQCVLKWDTYVPQVQIHTHFAFARLYCTVSDKVVLRQWRRRVRALQCVGELVKQVRVLVVAYTIPEGRKVFIGCTTRMRFF